MARKVVGCGGFARRGGIFVLYLVIFTTRPLIFTSRPLIFTTRLLIITARLLIFRGQLLIFTARLLIFTTRLLIFRGQPLIFTARAVIFTARWRVFPCRKGGIPHRHAPAGLKCVALRRLPPAGAEGYRRYVPAGRGSCQLPAVSCRKGIIRSLLTTDNG